MFAGAVVAQQSTVLQISLVGYCPDTCHGQRLPIQQLSARVLQYLAPFWAGKILLFEPYG